MHSLCTRHKSEWLVARAENERIGRPKSSWRIHLQAIRKNAGTHVECLSNKRETSTHIFISFIFKLAMRFVGALPVSLPLSFPSCWFTDTHSVCVCVSTISWIFVTGNVDLGSLSRSEWTGCTGLFIAVMFYANAQSHMCMDLTFQIGTPATTGTRTTQLANTLRLRVEEHNRER